MTNAINKTDTARSTQSTTRLRNPMADGYYPLTEARVVRELIRNRIKIDSTFAMKLYETDDPTISNGVPPFNEDIICLYIDLDDAIEKCGLSKTQSMVVGEMMKGYTISDIAECCFVDIVDQKTVLIHLLRSVVKICKYSSGRNTLWAINKLKG